MTNATASEPVVQLPFRIVGNHVELSATIGPSRPLTFLLETGAGMSALDAATARELGVAASGSLDAAGAGAKTVKIELGEVPEWRIGPLPLPPARLAIHDFGDIHRFRGRRLDGLLGRDVLSRYAVEIDFPARLLRLHAPEAFEYRGRGSTLPFRVDLNLINLPASIVAGGRTVAGELVLDTGAGGRTAVLLAAPFCREHGLPGVIPTVRLDQAGQGLGGAAIGDLGRLDKVRLGALDLSLPVTLFARDERGFLSWPGRAGVIGTEALRRARIWIDHRRARVSIEPGASWDSEFAWDASGLVLHRDGDRLERVAVRAVLPVSPAAEARIEPGDTILAVNGQAAADIPLHRLRDLMSRPGRRFLLALDRRGSHREATLETRLLI